jgi:hypothetical protein
MAVIKERPEVVAIGAMLDTLEPLDDAARLNAITFVLKQLNISIDGQQSTAAPASEGTRRQASAAHESPKGSSVAPTVVDIRTLKEEKQPRSANEMAALVAYYLQYAAPKSEQKHTIDWADIKKYFDQAKFEMPKGHGQTLVNSKAAGYLDSAGRKNYKLNAVGYNLVVHRLPQSADAGDNRRRRTRGGRKKPGPRKKTRRA